MQIWRKFRDLSAAITLGCALSGSAFANCQGTDLRQSLTAQERASFAQTVSALPYATGNHWRAVRADKVVHLIGTIHLNDARLDPITARLQGVVESSEMLLLEVTPKEEAALKADMLARPELMFLQGDTLPDLLNEEQWQRLSAAMQARGIPPMLASRFQP